MRRGLLVLTAVSAISQAQPTSDPPAVQMLVEHAKQLAGEDLTKPLFLCDPNGPAEFITTVEQTSRQWLEPTKVFDNLYYIGSAFVGVWVVSTSEGLILVDALGSEEDARTRLVPGLQKLGLDPAQIKYVLVTHGHWDHYGGAQYLRDTYGARIGLSEADWQLMARLEPGSPARLDRDPPKKDLVVTDGQKLTLGDTSLTIYVTPGHSPGTISMISPAREGGATYPLSLLGGTIFPVTLEPNGRSGGLLANSQSVERLADLSRRAGTVGLLNTHPTVDGSLERIQAAAVRKSGEPNPFVIGQDAVRRHYAIFDLCLQAAIARKRKA
jgi:metallo-beta-lactamase class B